MVIMLGMDIKESVCDSRWGPEILFPSLEAHPASIQFHWLSYGLKLLGHEADQTFI
jgi:hypothetical protein